MTQEQFDTSVRKGYIAALKRLQLTNKDVEINWNVPTIKVGDNFFAQGERASDILKTVIKLGNYTNEQLDVCLVYYLDTAAAI